jgi:hypothetical protein
MSKSPFLHRGKTFDGTFFLQKNIEYDNNGQELFIGYSAPGAAGQDAAWLISKYTRNVESSVTAIRFADGSILFEKAWDERRTYEY